MNERLKELEQQALEHPDLYSYDKARFIEIFAELIVKECKENFAKIWYEQGVDCRGAELGKLLTRFDEHFGVEE
jgi:hypothetical protein